MSSSNVNVQVSEDLVKPIIESRIQSAIIAELSKEKDLLDRIIAHALNMKVSSSGKRSQYSHDNKHPFVEVMCHQAIQAAARQAMEEWIKENHRPLVDAMKKQIQKSPHKLAKAFADGIAESAKSRWLMNVKVNLPGQDD